MPTTLRDIAAASEALKEERLIVWANGQRYLFAPNMIDYAVQMVYGTGLFEQAEIEERISDREWLVNREKSDVCERYIRERCG